MLAIHRLVRRQRTLRAMATIGAFVVLAADIVARLFDQDKMPVGIVTAFVGAPVLILLVRNSAGAGR